LFLFDFVLVSVLDASSITLIWLTYPQMSCLGTAHANNCCQLLSVVLEPMQVYVILQQQSRNGINAPICDSADHFLESLDKQFYKKSY